MLKCTTQCFLLICSVCLLKIISSFVIKGDRLQKYSSILIHSQPHESYIYQVFHFSLLTSCCTLFYFHIESSRPVTLKPFFPFHMLSNILTFTVIFFVTHSCIVYISSGKLKNIFYFSCEPSLISDCLREDWMIVVLCF